MFKGPYGFLLFLKDQQGVIVIETYLNIDINNEVSNKLGLKHFLHTHLLPYCSGPGG